MAWSFDVLYVVDEHRRQRHKLRLRWTVRRARGGGARLIVEATCLSFADELAESLGDRLEPEGATGALRLRSSGESFGTLVHGVPIAPRELLSEWVRPLIIVGPITTEDEVVAQLAIFALRAGGLLDDLWGGKIDPPSFGITRPAIRIRDEARPARCGRRSCHPEAAPPWRLAHSAHRARGRDAGAPRCNARRTRPAPAAGAAR